MTSTYSIRESLRGGLQDYIESSGFVDCTRTSNLILDLTGLLAAYREEDTALFPAVFIFGSLNAISSLAPAAAHIRVKETQLEDVKAEAILRDCAPLAEGGWSIYVAKTAAPDVMEYGLFRSLKHAIATSAEEAMAEGLANVPIVRLRNRGPMVVELRNTLGANFTVSLTPEPAKTSLFEAHIRLLATGVCELIDANKKNLCESTLTHFLGETIERCHGSLCAVVTPPSTSGDPPEGFDKSVWLSVPLRWTDAIVEAKRAGTAEALAELQAIQTLVRGMINSDGVVVFGSDGTIRGYRAILSPSDTEVPGLPVTGGARRRTHALMCKRLGAVLRVAFFRSQDGKTLCDKATA